MLFHKLYPVTASTIHNVICAQQTKNVRRAIADVCVLRRVPGTIWEWGGGGGKICDKRQRKTEIVTLAKGPSPSILFLFFVLSFAMLTSAKQERAWRQVPLVTLF